MTRNANVRNSLSTGRFAERGKWWVSFCFRETIISERKERGLSIVGSLSFSGETRMRPDGHEFSEACSIDYIVLD